MLLWLPSPLPIVRHGYFSSAAPYKGCPLHPLPTQATRTAGLVPVSCFFRALSPPAHRLATPCTSHTVPLSTVTTGFLVTNRILTRRASCASGRLSAHLSSMCLLGLTIKCVLSRGCCLRPSPSPSTVIVHTLSQGIYGQTGAQPHPAPSAPTLVLNHLHDPRKSVWKSQIQLTGQPHCLVCVYFL